MLGEDIGSSPFGRLQFEHGKLSATLRIGLDPLSVLAALSRPADENLRLEGVTVNGMRGRVHGFLRPQHRGVRQRYLEALSDDDHYLFSLEKREDVFGGITFSLIRGAADEPFPPETISGPAGPRHPRSAFSSWCSWGPWSCPCACSSG